MKASEPVLEAYYPTGDERHQLVPIFEASIDRWKAHIFHLYRCLFLRHLNRWKAPIFFPDSAIHECWFWLYIIHIVYIFNQVMKIWTLRVLENHKQNILFLMHSNAYAQDREGWVNLFFIFPLGKNPFHEQGRRQQCFYSPEKCLLLEMIFTLFLKSMPSLLVSWYADLFI